MKERRMPKIVDLFCGSGGLSLGFEYAGFTVALANDIDRHSIETYQKNHPDLPAKNVVAGDVSEFLKEHRAELKNGNFDVVMGGPPCQGFSTANRQRLINDPRNVLYKKFVEAIGLVQPKVFVMENVKGMRPYAEQIVSDFSDIGYTTRYEVLNAKKFGIPQNRERLVYVGIKTKAFVQPEAVLKKVFDDIHKNENPYLVPLSDALWGLRKLKARKEKGKSNIESEISGLTKDVIVQKGEPTKYILRINHGKRPTVVFNHKTRYNNPRDLEIYRLLPQGGKADHESIAHIMPYKKRADIFKDKFFKLEPGKICKTITAHMKFDCHMYIHPFEARGLTPREAARIQSFPDDYRFEGPFTQWYSQIGNAVPPLLGEIIAYSIKKNCL